MAIAITNLGASTGTSEVNPDIRSIADATSYSNTSWSPPASGIVFFFVMNGQNTVTDTTVDSIDQNGVALTRIGTDLQFSSSQRRISMFAAFANTLSTGVLTVNFGTDTQLFCYVSIFQITGADESGSISNAFIAATGTTGTGTTGSLTLASPQNSDSRSIAWIAHVANEVVTKGANFTKIDDMNGAGPALGGISEYSTSQFETTADASWTTSANWGANGAEIKAAAAAAVGTPKFARPGRRVPKALVGPRFLLDDDEILYTVPDGVRTLLRFAQLCNTFGSGALDVRLAIGDSNVQANIFLFESGENGVNYRFPRSFWFQIWMNPGETLRGYATQLNSVVVRVDGYERPAG